MKIILFIDIAQKYPDLRVLDIEEGDEDTHQKEGKREVLTGVEPLAVFITPRSTARLDEKGNDGKKKCNFPSPSPSPTSNTYATIVRRRLAHYQHS